MDKLTKDWIYLATLLHGVGLFYKNACGADARVDEHSCGSTVDFINNHSDSLRNLDGDASLFNSMIEWLSEEDSPDESISALIKKAGLLSACGENLEKMPHVQCPLRPIQESVGRSSTFVYKSSLLPKPYTISHDCFPNNEALEARDVKTEYVKVWNDFERAFCKIKASSSKAFAETLLGLLFKYASNIPVAEGNLQDVSLYDYVKTASALAVCLYDASNDGKSDGEPFLLVGADFSGIQAYIYNIVSKYAGKNLKGRSFYIRLLSDAIVRYILRKLNLPRANVIYNSGGGFYLIAPNTVLVKQCLKEAIDTITNKIFDAHGISLFVAIDYVVLPKSVLEGTSQEHLGDVWHKLFQKRDKAKYVKFHDIISSNYSSFFEPNKTASIACDSVTGEEITDDDDKRAFPDGGRVKSRTSEQIKLGEKLRDFNFVFITGNEVKSWQHMLHVDPLSLGIKYYFMNEKEWKSQTAMMKELSGSLVAVKYNDDGADNLFLDSFGSAGNILEWEFYGGNEVAGGKRCPTFEEICHSHDVDADNSGDAFERLGVLRMDVDNLGSIFQKGIDPSRSSLSRFSALSRSLDFFFSGYLNTVWKETDPEHSLIIYSGGDDLFIVGSWDVTLQLAERIREDFRHYTCGNPSFSISGGIAMIPAKFPIIKGASMSDVEESRAKAHTCGDRHKNSISFLGMALNWDYEYHAVKEAKDAIVMAINDKSKPLPRSFISKVLSHWTNAGIKNHQITAPKTFWMMAYDLSRMKDRVSDEAKKNIDICKDDVCSNKPGRFFGKNICTEYNPLELWALACRWAELEIRS